MKLNQFLHLLEPTELTQYLIHVEDFPREAGGILLFDFCTSLLNRGIREIEIFRSGGWVRSVFWSGRGLLIISPEPGEVLPPRPDAFIVSAYVDSPMSAVLKAAGHWPTMHPFSYNPEWTECFVFKI